MLKLVEIKDIYKVIEEGRNGVFRIQRPLTLSDNECLFYQK